ncbi:2-amino-4-hydroxy-6-hydroxymethyldihydropteridine diphosphokinase [Candidatus Peregrinibacteria bacterium]|nr:2-amino-4-hydroxy-6-hydroxymethyldihydropteridine diphosphokinase [Candidatus Peregrinibacteria bacterium]
MTNTKLITAYLSLGSNIGDRLDFLSAAKEKIENHPEMKLVAESQIYETEPWPHTTKKERFDDEVRPSIEEGPLWFLNQVIKIETDLEPDDLLEEIEQIEVDLGRKHKNNMGPREIDIDILLYGDEVIDFPHLQIPHRHIMDRRFVLEPLVEMEADLVDPRTGQMYRYILENLEDDFQVAPFL